MTTASEAFEPFVRWRVSEAAKVAAVLSPLKKQEIQLRFSRTFVCFESSVVGSRVRLLLPQTADRLEIREDDDITVATRAAPLLDAMAGLPAAALFEIEALGPDDFETTIKQFGATLAIHSLLLRIVFHLVPSTIIPGPWDYIDTSVRLPSASLAAAFDQIGALSGLARARAAPVDLFLGSNSNGWLCLQLKMDTYKGTTAWEFTPDIKVPAKGNPVRGAVQPQALATWTGVLSKGNDGGFAMVGVCGVGELLLTTVRLGGIDGDWNAWAAIQFHQYTE